MRIRDFIALYLAGTLAGFAQGLPVPQPGQIKDPRAILAEAAPFYDFSDLSLKPFHLKATYQLYDEKGNPAEQGVFEYWWVSPQIYRASWTRPSAKRTDWHTADGKSAYEATGEGLSFFEYTLQSALFSPLPKSSELDPAKNRLELHDVKLGTAKIPCIMVIPVMPQHGRVQVVPLGLFPTYCFDPELPALRASYSFGTIGMSFDHIVKTQERFLPREIRFYDRKQQILSAEVQMTEGIAPNDPALMPSAAAVSPKAEKVDLPADAAVARLVKRLVPTYPQDAKDSRVSGTVVLQAIIGTDGKIHDLRVVSAPWPSLAASSLWAVLQWEYKPYLLNGEPVEVETTINVIYSLGP